MKDDAVMSERLQLNEFEQVMDRLSPEVASLARQARALILEVCPESYEVVWVHQGAVGYGTGPRKMSEHFSWLQFTKSYVQLGFNYGAELKDASGLLEGTGARMRHVKIRSAEDLDRPGVRALLQQAVKHRVPPAQPLAASTAEEKPVGAMKATARRAVAATKKKLGAARKAGASKGAARKQSQRPAKTRRR